MNIQSFNHPIVWSIILLGFFIYHRLLFANLRLKKFDNYEFKHWQSSLNMCICALPLLGLLGTISGLLDAFGVMSKGQGFGQSRALTQGIANALWTTQLGLVLAVPAWLLFAYTDKRINKYADSVKIDAGDNYAS
jgi:biopolymer transport protein ExbB